MKYIKNQPVIGQIHTVSTPGNRIYLSIRQIRFFLKKKESGFCVISTSKGLLSDEEALLFGVGGEVLLKVK